MVSVNAASKPAEIDIASTELESVYHSIKRKQVALLNDKPVRIVSSLNEDRLSANIYAVRKLDFNLVKQRLSKPEEWCQLVTLHLNIKACVFYQKPKTAVSFFAGRKFYQPADDAFELHYQFKREYADERFLQIKLSAKEGPFGTSDYLIRLQALKVADDVLLHFSLGYTTSMASRIGTSVYLSTTGSGKLGFSQRPDGQGEMQYTQGVEAIIERNVMRYFLALDVYFEFKSEHERVDAWYQSTEQFRAQLYEVEKSEYLDAKRQEFLQQRKMQARLDQGLPLFDADESDDF